MAAPPCFTPVLVLEQGHRGGCSTLLVVCGQTGMQRLLPPFGIGMWCSLLPRLAPHHLFCTVDCFVPLLLCPEALTGVYALPACLPACSGRPTAWSVEHGGEVAACLERLPGTPAGCTWNPDPRSRCLIVYSPGGFCALDTARPPDCAAAQRSRQSECLPARLCVAKGAECCTFCRP